MQVGLDIQEVTQAPNIEHFRTLLRSYSEEFPGRFSNRINEDLAELPGRYAAPTGGLFVGYLADLPVCTAAWTRVNEQQAEIKRVYIVASSRGRGFARKLTDTVVTAARAAGYSQLVLSTWDENIAAIALYRKLGFVDIVPFKSSPFTNLMYLGLAL